MKQKEKKLSNGSVSIANLISIVGIVAVGVFMYLGKAFSEGDKGMSLLFAVSLSTLFAFLLWLMVHAKGVDNDFKKWRFVEYFSLAAYCIAALSTVGIISHFFSVNSQSDTLKMIANKDVLEIKKTIDVFQTKETEALKITVTGMMNCVSMGDFSANDQNLKDFFTENAVERNDGSVKNFKEKWEEKIKNVTSKEDQRYKEVWLRRLKICHDKIEGWSVLEIPDAIQDLKEIGQSVFDLLNAISPEMPFHAIERAGSGYHIANRYTGNSYSVTLTFPDEVKNISDFSLTGIILAIMMHVLVLFNYVVAYRSGRVGVSKHKRGHDAGRLLKN